VKVFHEGNNLEALIEKVQAHHRDRLDLPIHGVEHRPFKARPRPKTAIFGERANELDARKGWGWRT